MAENLKHLSDENFDSEIAQGVTLVDFYADWCGPCRILEPIISKLAEKFQGKAKIAKLDIESSQTTTSNFNVTSIPTMILFKEGKEVQRIVGIKDEDALTKIVEEALE